MSQSPDVTKSKPSVSPGPRARRWAARLALLVACAGSVATSPTSFRTTGQYEGPLLRLLSPEQPKLTRTLVASVSVEEAMAAHVDGSLSATLHVTWKPTDPSDQATPTLRVRFRSPDHPSDPNEVPDDHVIERPGQQVVVQGDYLSCALDEACERRFLFTFEVLPRSAQGALEVEWTVWGEIGTNDTEEEPKGLKLQITEQ